MEHLGLLDIWDYEGSNPKDKVGTLRIRSKKGRKLLGP